MLWRKFLFEGLQQSFKFIFRSPFVSFLSIIFSFLCYDVHNSLKNRKIDLLREKASNLILLLRCIFPPFFLLASDISPGFSVLVCLANSNFSLVSCQTSIFWCCLSCFQHYFDAVLPVVLLKITQSLSSVNERVELPIELIYEFLIMYHWFSGNCDSQDSFPTNLSLSLFLHYRSSLQALTDAL